jgi:O-antigen ligase
MENNNLIESCNGGSLRNGTRKFLSFAFGANILALLLAYYQSTWDHAMLLLPWAFVLADRELRSISLQIIQTQRALTATSGALALLIAASCHFNAGNSQYLDATLPPILWIPVSAYCILDSRRKLYRVYFLLYAAVSTMAATIIWQLLVEGATRPRGLSFNVLTGPMMLAMICLLGAIKSNQNIASQKNRDNYNFICISVLGLAGAMCSQSRTSLISFVCASFVFLYFSHRNNARTGVILATIIFFWTLTQFNHFTLGKKQLSDVESGKYVSSIGERRDGLIWGKQHIFDNPWIGIGTSQVQEGFNHRGYEWKRENPDHRFIPHLHNDYLQIALSNGVPSLVCYAFMWLLLGRKSINKSATSPAPRNKANRSAWILSMISIYLTASLTDSFTFWIYTWATVSCCFGIAIGLLNDEIKIAPIDRSTFNS